MAHPLTTCCFHHLHDLCRIKTLHLLIKGTVSFYLESYKRPSLQVTNYMELSVCVWATQPGCLCSPWPSLIVMTHKSLFVLNYWTRFPSCCGLCTAFSQGRQWECPQMPPLYAYESLHACVSAVSIYLVRCILLRVWGGVQTEGM